MMRCADNSETWHRRTSSSGGHGLRGSHDSDGLQAASQVPEVIGEELPPTLLEVCIFKSSLDILYR